MILVELTVPGKTSNPQRISLNSLALEHYWDNRVISFDSPEYKMKEKYGGYCELGWGDIELDPRLFEDVWPAPVQCIIVIKYTETTEAAAVTLFTGTAHVANQDKGSIVYDLYGEEFDDEILDTTTNYDGDTDVPLPRAFGLVEHVNPIRVADQSSAPTYHKGYITSGFTMYDDGVSVSYTDNGDGTASLNATPVGEVTISGTGEDSTLSDIFDWACGASYLNLTYTNTNARSTSPTISHWLDSQELIVDYLSSIAASCTHLFYISGTTLNLVAMENNNGTRTSMDDYDFFAAPIQYNDPVKSIETSWEKATAGQWSSTTPGSPAGVYVKREEKETSVLSAYTYGQEMSVDCFYNFSATNDQKSVNESRLTTILGLIHKPLANVSIPLQDGLPVPGEQLTVVDDQQVDTITKVINARNITFNFTKETIIITGEGAIS